LRFGVFRPAQFAESGDNARERQANHIEIAALDPWNIASGTPLNCVSARFVEGLFRREVARNFISRKLCEMNQGCLDELAAVHLRQTNERNACDNGVSAAGEQFKHMPRVIGRAGLAEDLAFQNDDRVCRQDDNRADRARHDELGLGVRKSLHELLRCFPANRRFVNGRGEDGEGNFRVTENFRSARRGGSEDKLHEGRPAGRILQSEKQNSLCFGTAAESFSAAQPRPCNQVTTAS
jgi:hypothetical protein